MNPETLQEKKIKPLNSQIDFRTLISLLILLLTFTIASWNIIADNMYRILSVVLSIIIAYILIHSIAYLYCFCDNYIKIIYIFPLWKKGSTILYSDIINVQYLNNSAHRSPILRFELKGNQSQRINSLNTCSVVTFSRRKEILFFLHEKKIPIYFESFSIRDKNIKKVLDNS